jgi:SAM-dependent methyltransferase
MMSITAIPSRAFRRVLGGAPGADLRAARWLTAAPVCDCCGRSAWRYLFTLDGVDLGRCSDCALHYVAQLPERGVRHSEVQEGTFRGEHKVTSADIQREFELQSSDRFAGYIDMVQRHAPPGRWFDIGCGTGTLIELALERGVDVEGIELGRDRLAMARRVTGVPIHDRPLEELDVEPGSLAAVTMVDVFSHLTSPMETLGAVHRALNLGGALLLHTSEIGDGVKPRHQRAWELGEHLFFLGEGTMERYAAVLGFQVVERQTVWQPDTLWVRESFRMRGRSRMRDLTKRLVLYTPGAFRLLRWYMVSRRQADNPVHISTMALKKRG